MEKLGSLAQPIFGSYGDIDYLLRHRGSIRTAGAPEDRSQKEGYGLWGDPPSEEGQVDYMGWGQ